MSRDPQRHLVYDAQAEAKLAFPLCSLNPVECQFLVQDIRNHPELLALHGAALEKRIRLVIKKASHGISAYAMDDVIYLPKWAQNNWTVCHEIAHIIDQRTSRKSEGHGPSFCAIYASLVEKMISKDAGDALKESFDKHGVDYR